MAHMRILTTVQHENELTGPFDGRLQADFALKPLGAIRERARRDEPLKVRTGSLNARRKVLN